MKKIGLLSDIHGYWDPKFAHYFSSCDEIWIAGDIGDINVVENLEKIKSMNVEKITNDLINWIKKWFDENGPNCNAVIGVSGGKDSSIIAELCVRALGPDRVLGVLMPNGVQKDINDSIEVCKHIGIRYITVNIAPAVEALKKETK